MADRGPLDAEAVAALAAALTLKPLPSARRAALRTRVVADATQTTRIERAVHAEWRAFIPGISIRFLRVDVQARTQTSLWRLDDGARIPPHAHRDDEECLVLAGVIAYEGDAFGAGDYLHATSGAAHAEFVSRGESVLLIRSELTSVLEALAFS